MVGAQPTMEVLAKENKVTLLDHHEGQRTEVFEDDPMAIPRRVMEKWKPQGIDELPEAFCGNKLYSIPFHMSIWICVKC